VSIPKKNKNKYNQSISGFFGEFGTGGNAKVFFLQSGISPKELNKIDLISDIRGSERWSVRDLFQREVDDDRVTDNILPYFMDDKRIKFFNPLTLTLLPTENLGQGTKIIKEIPNVEIHKETINGDDWIVYEADPYFRFRHSTEGPEYGVAEWQDNLVNVVAIDGQHRLSALKRYFKDPNSDQAHKDFLQWTIPVVILTLRSLDSQKNDLTLLDVTRNLFVYINKEAKKPSEGRQILLSDESINAVCTQEILEYAHKNDLKEPDERDDKKIPLLFFAWRDSDDSPCHLKEVREVYDWLVEYILGSDFDDYQKASLNINPNHPLNDVFFGERKSRRLTNNTSKILRDEFCEKMLPGITYFFENFIPYKDYIAGLRKIEYKILKESDLARHAFAELRFGGRQGPQSQYTEIQDIKDRLIQEICAYKEGIDILLQRDIGMRGIVSAFGELRSWYRESVKEDNFIEYSRWFTDSLNIAFKEKWFDSTNKNRALLLQITHDQHETTINYRLADAKKALGSFVTLLVGAYGKHNFKHPTEEVYLKLKEKFISKLEDVLMKGYKKEERANLKSQHPHGKELDDAVKKAATKRTGKHLERLIKVFETI